MSFWDWKSGHRFQSLDSTAQPGSLDAEAGIMSSTFDRSGLRLITGEADKTSEYNSRPINRVRVETMLTKIWQSKYGSRTRLLRRRLIPYNGIRH